jgi:hypothetical protein
MQKISVVRRPVFALVIVALTVTVQAYTIIDFSEIHKRVDTNFDPFAQISGYEIYGTAFAFANSSKEVAEIKRKIDQELHDRSVIEQAGFEGIVARFLVSLLEPVIWLNCLGFLISGLRSKLIIAAGFGSGIAVGLLLGSTKMSYGVPEIAMTVIYHVGAGLFIGALMVAIKMALISVPAARPLESE